MRAKRVDYVFGLARNTRLVRAIGRELHVAAPSRTGRCARRGVQRTRLSHPHELEPLTAGGRQGRAHRRESNPRFVVTSLPDA